MKHKNTQKLTLAAMTAAAYAALSLLGAVFGLTFGPIQVRFSEALCLPPVVCNMVLVGAVLAYETAGTSAAFWPAYGLNALTVGLGEAIACLVLGVLLVKQLPKIPYFRNRLAS